MDLKEIAELIEIIDGADIEEFELEREGVRIRVRKGKVQVISAPASAPAPSTGPMGSEAGPALSPKTEDRAVAKEKLHLFKAPIVGTFYITPKPDAGPFVKPGDAISPGSNLCIIEAMKIFNTIESDVQGEIVRILVENGQPVEYGEALFEIRLDS